MVFASLCLDESSLGIGKVSVNILVVRVMETLGEMTNIKGTMVLSLHLKKTFYPWICGIMSLRIPEVCIQTLRNRIFLFTGPLGYGHCMNTAYSRVKPYDYPMGNID